MNHQESTRQIAAVRWFRYQYPKLSLLLFSVPNGGYRPGKTGRFIKAEGVVKGVSDLILLTPCNGYASLCIEYKSDKGKQRPEQIEWQKQAENAGNKYVIVRCFDEFKNEIENYLNQK